MNPTTRQVDRDLPYVMPEPPMPWKEYRDQAFREWARKFAILVLVSLVILAIVFPWGQQ